MWQLRSRSDTVEEASELYFDVTGFTSVAEITRRFRVGNTSAASVERNTLDSGNATL